eukprot:CAMPEP_0196717644 /NCGR_PEP_ID=MMETSP1091-20130531/1007_1 /TAXON_ID=302021 /ORGANISM="Rhodomonas sp., Strain CCMP768" /LENGTH=369 /DNA_ID=CAMNT_0042058063 /DNA_START=113 /DNA_END=1222 /DNA_ORIENTATION=-
MWKVGAVFPLTERLSFAAHKDDQQTSDEIRSHPDLFFCSTDLHESYFPFCADFGPVNLGMLFKFCEFLRGVLNDQRIQNRTIVYYVNDDHESIANATFLLSAFLMLEEQKLPEEALLPFSCIKAIPLVPFRDASFKPCTFPLTVLDCLRGLSKAVSLNWFSLDNFDCETYFEHDDPENGDLHAVCPKFVAFRGPDRSCPDTPPTETYVKLLAGVEVSTVVNLEIDAEYNHDTWRFEEAGIRSVDLAYGRGALPSDGAVRSFFRECAKPERLGVTCQTGLGRTGTMIGLWLMRSGGFTAREAIAWLRLVRPGSVIGPQQEYLQAMELRLQGRSFPEAEEAGGVSDGNNGPAETVPVVEPCLCLSDDDDAQ